jgi:RNA polymerase sigma-70 factor (ECF subfamily)
MTAQLAPSYPESGTQVARPTFPALYDDHVDLVWRTLRRLGIAEANLEDSVQEVFVVAHRKLDSFEGRSSVSTWLYGITILVARNARRHARRHPEAELSEAQEPVMSTGLPDEVLLEREAALLVEKLLDQLDEEKREVLVLAELEQLSGAEIAISLGLNVNTVYARLRAARQQFDAAVIREQNRPPHVLVVKRSAK